MVKGQIEERISKLKQNFKQPTGKVLQNADVKACLSDLHNQYVFVQADKAPNNIIIICKRYYVETLKHRFIAGSSKCTTKQLFSLLTKILTVIKTGLEKYCSIKTSHTGINMCILKNSINLLSSLSHLGVHRATSIQTFDFSTLYTLKFELHIFWSLGKIGKTAFAQATVCTSISASQGRLAWKIIAYLNSLIHFSKNAK